MKVLIVVIAILSLSLAASAREIDGAFVTLVSPSPLDIVPSTVMTFVFFVQNDSGDAEWLTNIHITLPDGFNLVESSMGFAEIDTGRPSFDMTVNGQTAQWDDNDGGYGEIYSTEATEVWVDAFVPGCYECGEIPWELWGDVYGEEPHYVSGVIDLCPSPVEESTWGSIKGLYR